MFGKWCLELSAQPNAREHTAQSGNVCLARHEKLSPKPVQQQLPSGRELQKSMVTELQPIPFARPTACAPHKKSNSKGQNKNKRKKPSPPKNTKKQFLKKNV